MNHGSSLIMIINRSNEENIDHNDAAMETGAQGDVDGNEHIYEKVSDEVYRMSMCPAYDMKWQHTLTFLYIYCMQFESLQVY